MNKHFNSVRYAKKFLMNPADEIRVQKILKMAGKNKKVLDLGCGDGFLMQELRKNNNTVVGIDIASKALEKAQKRGLNVFDLDLNTNWSKGMEEHFDSIVAGEIIEHIFDTDLFLKNIYKVLKKNGTLILSTPNIASLARRIMLLLGINPHIEVTARAYDAGHIRYFTFKSLKKLLEENGFKVINFTSDSVNFDNKANIKSQLLADIFPTIGKTLIVKAIKLK